MGQKVHPKIFRISGGTQKANCEWYVKTKKLYEDAMYEDLMIMNYLDRCEISQHIGNVTIERKSDVPHIAIHAGRTVAVFGKKGKSLEKIQEDLFYIIGKKPTISVVDIKKPDLNARLLANTIAKSIRNRSPYKKAVKTAMENARRAGVSGIKVMVSGRLNGAEIARSETFREGSMPLHTIRANIDHHITDSITT